jgi:hypothetical protein
MKKIVHRAEERGSAEFGWLHAKHSFSFGRWYDPGKMGFGLLRVLNDDVIEPATGFGSHPHDNMEIVTVILEGSLEHKDSMGTGSVIRVGEVQAMSAGTGVTHSEFNPSKSEKTNLLQLWIIPKERNIAPRYSQNKFPLNQRTNKIKTIVSGESAQDTIYIHQDAAISLGNLSKGNNASYKMMFKGNGVYLFVISGQLKVDSENLYRRDSLGIYDVDEFYITADEDSDFLLVEVPMQ